MTGFYTKGWSVHILNKNSVGQRYFMKTRIIKGVTILNPVTSVMWARYAMMIDKCPIEWM